VLHEGQRRLVVSQRFAQRAPTMVNLCDAANRRQVFGCALQHVFEFALRRVELVHLQQGTSECNPRRKVAWMDGETGSTDGNRVSIAARPPVLLGELSECNRRRVLCDPASKFFYTGIVGHGLL
jgi:hypothetical protein